MCQSLKLILIAVILFSDATIAQGKNLLEFYHMAIQTDTTLAMAESSLSSTRARLDQSQSWVKPQISMSANQKENRGTFNYLSRGYGLTLTQSLFNYDRWKAIGEAKEHVAQDEAEFEDARQNLILRVATAYFNFLTAEDGVELAKAEKHAIGQQLNQTKQRFKAGLSAIIDVADAQAAYDLAATQEIIAQSSLDNAHEAIYVIAGQKLDNIAKLEAVVPLISPEPKNINSWIERSLKKSLDIIAKQAEVDAESKALERAKGGHLPTLDLVAGRVYNDNSGLKFGLETTTNYVGVEFGLPIYSGGLTTAKIREATSKLFQAKTMLEQTRRETIRQTHSAYLAVSSGIALVKAQKQSVISAKVSFEAIQAGFEAGSRTMVDMFNSQSDLYRAENDFSHARYDYLLAILTLKEAVSGLRESDLVSINNLLEHPSFKMP